jgi:hypothetical protein
MACATAIEFAPKVYAVCAKNPAMLASLQMNVLAASRNPAQIQRRSRMRGAAVWK